MQPQICRWIHCKARARETRSNPIRATADAFHRAASVHSFINSFSIIIINYRHLSINENLIIDPQFAIIVPMVYSPHPTRPLANMFIFMTLPGAEESSPTVAVLWRQKIKGILSIDAVPRIELHSLATIQRMMTIRGYYFFLLFCCSRWDFSEVVVVSGQEEKLDCPFYSHSPTEGGRRQRRRLTGSDDDSCADALFLVDSNCRSSSKKCIRCHVDNKKAPGDHPILILIMIIVIISSPAAFQLFISIIYCSSPKETIRCCCCSSSGWWWWRQFFWNSMIDFSPAPPITPPPPTSTECNFNWFSNIYKGLRI